MAEGIRKSGAEGVEVRGLHRDELPEAVGKRRNSRSSRAMISVPSPSRRPTGFPSAAGAGQRGALGDGAAGRVDDLPGAERALQLGVPGGPP